MDKKHTRGSVSCIYEVLEEKLCSKMKKEKPDGEKVIFTFTI